MNTANKTQQQRTQDVIDYFRGLPGEWGMLKGLLCMEHALTGEALHHVEGLFDRLMIAKRMDEIINEQAKAA